MASTLMREAAVMHNEQPRRFRPNSGAGLRARRSIHGQDARATLDERLGELRRMLEHYRLARSERGGGGAPRFVPTGIGGLDRRLPHGGLPAGAITEIVSRADGVGGTTLAFMAAGAASAKQRPIVVVDTRGDLYPPAVWSLGIDPNRLLVVRTSQPEAASWVVDQSLRCPGIAAVVAFLPQLDAARSRCLQLSAESGDALGLLLRPQSNLNHSFAALRLLVEPVEMQEPTSRETVQPSRRGHRLCRVTLIKVREGMPEESFVIGLDDEANSGSLLPVSVDRPDSSESRRVSA